MTSQYLKVFVTSMVVTAQICAVLGFTTLCLWALHEHDKCVYADIGCRSFEGEE